MADPRSSSRRLTRLGISEERLNEIVGFLILFLALVCFLSVSSIHRHSNLIGPVGAWIANALVFLLGQGAAYAVPAILAIWGVTRFRGVPWGHAPLKLLGLLLVAFAGCGLLAQTGYDMPRFHGSPEQADVVSFNLGGAVGSFLVSEHGIHLPSYVGHTGTYLALTTALAIGILLATNFLFYRFFAGLWMRMRWGHEKVSGRVQRVLRKLGQKSPRTPSRFRRSETTRILGGAPAAELERALDLSPPPDILDRPPPVVEPDLHGDVAAEEEEEEETEPEDALGLAAAARGGEQLDLFAGYQLPQIGLLTPPPPANVSLSEEDIELLSRTIEEKLASFGIEVRVTHATQGPVVTLFELRPAPGVKINRIVTLENDLAMALRASRLRILAPIPGRGAVGIEIPNRKASIVCLREILESRDFHNGDEPLLFGLGKTIDGRPYICNMSKMPHLLIAGATGSGKSVCLNAIICSLLFRNSPDRVRFIMIDPKRVEMAVYRKIPHLLAPVVSEPRKCAAALAWAVGQMEERYRILADMNVRGIDAYNNLARDPEKSLARRGKELPYMPHIVIVVDELADLMLIARNEVEENVIRLAQMSRAVGIHLIIATQRPSVNVITGIIKANFPSRIAFQVSSKVDSRTILDMNGAEALLGQGDMLFSPGGSMRPVRLQGAFVSDGEVEDLVEFITAQGEIMTEEELAAAEREIASVEEQSAALQSQLEEEAEEDDAETVEDGPRSIDDAERILGHERDAQPVRVQYAVDDFTAPDPEDEMTDELYEKALRLILETRKASVSMIQRRMKIGYARAGRLMDIMEDHGIVGPYQGSKPRQILVDPVQYLKNLGEKD